MPIQKVDFKIENIYDANNSIKEKLFLDIWTNGSISPDDSISEAAKFIIELFTSIIENKFIQELAQIDSKSSNILLNPHINIAIEELQLSVRAYNCLKRAQINTIGDLLNYSPEKLQELKNFGRKSSDEVFNTLKNKLGIVLK
jgi:DNA-directed RNA polymerase subunit alpha